MKKAIKKTLLLISVFSIFPLSIQADTFTAKANLLSAITISEVTALNFGIIALKGTTDSIITLGYTDNTSSSGQSIAGAGAKTGKYKITGTASTPVNISVSKATDLSNGTDTLTTTFTTNSSSITLDATGNFTISVGGTITVNSTKSTGLYSGQLNVVANY